MEDPHEINAAKADIACYVNIIIYLLVYIYLPKLLERIEKLLTQAILQ